MFPITFLTLYYFRDKFMKIGNRSGEDATLTTAEAVSLAGQIETTMSNFGTDTEELFGLVSGLNGADLVKVYNAFGFRPYNSAMGVSSGILFGEKKSLFEWFRNELSKKDLERMKEIFKPSKLPF